jgi:hypothetical protein
MSANVCCADTGRVLPQRVRRRESLFLVLLLLCEPVVELLSLDGRVDLFQSLLHAPFLDACEFIVATASSRPDESPAEQVNAHVASTSSQETHAMMRKRRAMTMTEGTTMATMMVPPSTETSASIAFAMMRCEQNKSNATLDGNESETPKAAMHHSRIPEFDVLSLIHTSKLC